VTPHRHRAATEHGSLAVALALLSAATLALGAALGVAGGRDAHAGSTTTSDARTIGYGQIRYAGAGPERWALRWRREHRKVARLQRRLQATGHVLPARGIVRDFLCVYGGENAGYGWSANTGNGYYGGLQMDLDFQRTWGREFFAEWGTADHWPAEVQIAVAIRAYFHRGWQPWPNTSRACGLR
jgi:hypothetical protein